ncbi:MAG: DUF3299 domain-containing protein [Halioglobus sp.]|nr:DUF3299 domain-containing protein [Halioglobus sp.]MDG2327493.1 DUF3299 domain-containing protein [Halioglobus sp.]
MKIFRRLLEVCVIAGAICLATLGFAKDAPDEAEVPAFTTLEWTDLIPPADLEILLNPPQYVTQVEDGSVEDQISSQIQNSLEAASDDRYQQALSSTKVNAELNGAKIRLPGFIVPLEFDEQQTVTQFFLVPYFGACLHMPPPPPNQIILVNSPDGIQLQELYMPFWILGELSTSITENDMATAAYSLRMAGIEAYTE